MRQTRLKTRQGLTIETPDSFYGNFHWNPDNDGLDEEYKKLGGGFLIGCSIEFLLLSGVVAFNHSHKKEVRLGGSKYKVIAPADPYLITYYFEYLGTDNIVTSNVVVQRTSPPPAVHISQVLPNPHGPDHGREQIHITNSGSTEVSLDNWTVKGGVTPQTEALERAETHLSGSVAPGRTSIFTPKLGETELFKNHEVTLRLRKDGEVMDEVKVPKRVKSGVSVSFIY